MTEHREEGARKEEPLRELFGLDLDDARWLERVRRSGRHTADSPRRIGDYEVIGVVGRGGQGVVYRARQPRTDREIALKRLSAGIFATEEMRARFAREVEAASALDHPNIVTVYGSENIDGQPVLAMKWIDGVPFDRWAAGDRPGESSESRPVEGEAARGPRRTVRDVLNVFARVCEAVQHAHQRGVIHRDLKPSNILVDRADQPHVLDFGLAKIAHGTDDVRDLTHTGEFVGTPAYAAPELAAGHHRDVDVRTDVYALGAMLFQALTGRRIFEPSLGLQELLREIQVREVPAPSSFDARLGPEIDAIVLKALSKDKEQRYSSVEALGADVGRYLAGQAVLAHPPSTVYRVRKFIRQHVAMVAIGTTLFLAIAAAAVVSALLYRSSERERSLTIDALRKETELRAAVDDQSNSREHELHKARAAELFQERLLGRALHGAQGGVPVITLREALDQVAAELDRESGVEPEDGEAWVRMSIGNAYAGLGLPGPARPQFERALALRRALYEGDDLDVADSMEKLGRACRTLGDLDEAERMLEGALDMRRRLVKEGDGYLAISTNSLAILKRHRHKYLEAEALFLESLDHYVLGQGPEDESVPVVLKNLGLVYLDTNRLAEAEDALRRAHDLAIKLHGQRNTDVASCQINLAAVLTRLRRFEEAEALCRPAIDTLVELHGDRFGMLAIAQERLAEVCRRTGRLEEADHLLEEASASHRLVGNPTDIARCLVANANVLQELSRGDDAEARIREAIAVVSASLAPTDEIVLIAKASLGRVLAARDCCEEAMPLLLETGPILEHAASAGSVSCAEQAEDVRRLIEHCAGQRSAMTGEPR